MGYTILKIAVFATAVFIIYMATELPNRKSTVSAHAERPENTLQVMCETIALKVLKAPATANFATGNEISVSNTQDGSYLVISYVDAQNSFGALLRNPFQCKFIKEANGSWRLQQFKFDGEYIFDERG